MDPTHLTMLEMSSQLGSGELSAVELTKACLARVQKVDPKVRAFLRRDEKGALEQAESADSRGRAKNPASPLDGVPIALKDIFCTRGVETTCGSRILKGYVPPYDANVVIRLKMAGMPILGKVNQDEFAMGSSTEASAFHPTHNPWDLTRTPGGSSGGSAAAVAAREAPSALGTDTGGSIRQPASLTNVVGLKPTYGRVSRYGVIAFASSLDQVGPITRTVPDCAALLQMTAGHDPNDSTSARIEAPDYSADLEGGVEGMKFGLPREYFVDGMDSEVRAAVEAAAREYEKLGARVVNISLPHTRYALATYYLIAPAEASSNLARYDGVRFGHRATGTKGLREMYFQTREEGFGPEVKRRIMLGTYALSAGYYDAHYLKAQKVRTLIIRDFARAYESFDVLLSPTSPSVAFAIGAKVDDPLLMYLNDACTLPVNIAGLPGISVPCGLADGLPVGLQVIGRAFDESTILRVADAYERAAGFAQLRPPTSTVAA